MKGLQRLYEELYKEHIRFYEYDRNACAPDCSKIEFYYRKEGDGDEQVNCKKYNKCLFKDSQVFKRCDECMRRFGKN